MNPNQRLKHKLNNTLQSVLLILSMAGLLSLLGWLIAGYQGLLWSVVMCLLALIFGSRVSPGVVLRLYRASPIPAWQAPQLYQIVEAPSRRAGLVSLPLLYYVPSKLLNAFAVGSRKEAAIALTDGLLRTLSLRELTGVLAHELNHVRHNDMWVMGLADVVSRMTLVLSQAGQLLLVLFLPFYLLGSVQVSLIGLLVLVFAPLASTLLQLALSRTREFDADLGAAELTGDPQGLASALQKIERYQGEWFERIFMPGRRLPEPAVLRTHPVTAERIRRLLALSPRQDRFPAFQEDSAQSSPMRLSRLPGVTRLPRWHLNGLWY